MSNRTRRYDLTPKQRLHNCEQALRYVHHAYQLLQMADAPQAVKRVRTTLKSLAGAANHARARVSRLEQP